MKVIDVFTGFEAVPGRQLVSSNSGRPYVLHTVKDTFLGASVEVRFLDNGEVQRCTAMVRYLHPGFMFQKVAFIEP